MDIDSTVIQSREKSICTSELMDILRFLQSKIINLEKVVGEQSNVIQALIDEQKISSTSNSTTSIPSPQINSLQSTSENTIFLQSHDSKHRVPSQRQQVKQSKSISHDDNGKQTATPQPHIPNPSNTSPKNHQSAEFDPTKQFTNANPFNQDQIRKVINDIHGPIIIEKIVPYKYQTNKPKITIQFNTVDKAKRIVSAWKSNAFEGSTARLTINPQELNKLSCMMKGVPLSATDEEIQADV